MSDLLTIEELQRLQQIVFMDRGQNSDLLDKIRGMIEEEYRVGHSRHAHVAVTPSQRVKQMILNSPLGHLPANASINTVSVTFQFPWLHRLIEAVHAL